MIPAQLTSEHVVAGGDDPTGTVEAGRPAKWLLGAGGNPVKVGAVLEGEAEQTVSFSVDGLPARALPREVTRRDAALATVSTCIHSRLWQVLPGGVARKLLQRAPCSVLVARVTPGDGASPRSRAAGLGDSPESGSALPAARYLEQRFTAPPPRTVEPVEALLGAAGHAVLAMR